VISHLRLIDKLCIPILKDNFAKVCLIARQSLYVFCKIYAKMLADI
jgi:hypothetical protein